MKNKFILSVFLITFILSIYYCIEMPILKNNDYSLYTLHWNQILSGGDPWIGSQFSSENQPNPYGPLYILFAIPYSVHSKLPTIIWALFLFGFSYWLIKQIFDSNHLADNFKIMLSGVVLLSPFLWLVTIYLAQFDIVVAVISLSAVEAKRRKRSVLAGILISLAISLKYYPIVIVPFLFVSEKRLDFNFIKSFIISTIIIFVIPYSIWGNSLLIPIKFASQRPSKLLSIFKFLKSEFSPLKQWSDINNVDKYSLPLLISSGGALFIVYLIKEIDFITGSVLAITVTLLFYKVGHPQFHVTLYLFLIYWITFRDSLHWASKTAIIIYMFFINLFVIGYPCFSRYLGKWLFVRDLCGLVAFFIIGFLFIVILIESMHAFKKFDELYE